MVDEAEEDWGKKEMAITATAKNRIMIFGPKPDGTYVVEFGRPKARRWRSQYRAARRARLAFSANNPRLQSQS
jgi:hypothetical protein